MAPQPTESTGPRPIPRGHPDLLPFLPLVWVAWADGVLSPGEMAEIRRRIETEGGLSEDARRVLESWLDPNVPPDAAALTGLRERIREIAAKVPEEERRTLASLGAGMARAGSAGPQRWATAEGGRVLRGLEELMGVLGGESSRDLLTDGHPDPPEPAAAPPDERPVAATAIAAYLDGPYAEHRARVNALLREPALRIPSTPLETAEHRRRVVAALDRLAAAGLGRTAFPAEYGGADDTPGSIATFEALAYGDLSLLVKFGVQFGLFGGSVWKLGTERHHRAYLRAIGDGELPGCFAMTERGHGSNVREIETRARYLPESEEFEIHTPHPEARKDWIGNAAEDGRMATVFAQLETDGEEHGVHAFLVPIRDRKGRPLEGVGIEDCGEKVGLHGVDNGRLSFDRIRIPRDNLLDRFGQVGADGRYHSAIASDGKRFFSMLGTLVTGRISIAAASVSASKTALAIAVRYSARRRQFGPPGRPEVPVLDYLTHQRLLLPRVAASYALHFAVRDLVRRHDEADSEDARARVEALAAGLKAYASRHAQETIQAAREALGGRGYLAVNRLGRLRDDTDVFTTFEGANVVLHQLVAKRLLSSFRDDVEDLRFRGMVRFLAERVNAEATRRNPVRSRRTDEETLRDPEDQLETFVFREERLLYTAARRMKHRIDEGMDSFQAMNECQDHLVHLARAHVERVVLESFRRAVEGAPNPGVAAELRLLTDVWALRRIEEDRAWFLESGYLEGRRTRAVRALLNRLLGELRTRAVLLVDGFGIPDDILAAPDAL